MDVATGAAITVDDNYAVGTIVPLSSTKDKGAHIIALVAFEGTCVGVFTDGARCSGLAPWGTRTVVTPVDSIVAGKAITYLKTG